MTTIGIFFEEKKPAKNEIFLKKNMNVIILGSDLTNQLGLNLSTTVLNYSIKLQWRSEEGQGGGAAAPGRRPEGGAKILPKNF